MHFDSKYVRETLESVYGKPEDKSYVREINVRMNTYMALCYCRQILMDIDSKNYQASRAKSIISMIRYHLDKIESEIANTENKH